MKIRPSAVLLLATSPFRVAVAGRGHADVHVAAAAAVVVVVGLERRKTSMKIRRKHSVQLDQVFQSSFRVFFPLNNRGFPDL